MLQSPLCPVIPPPPLMKNAPPPLQIKDLFVIDNIFTGADPLGKTFKKANFGIFALKRAKLSVFVQLGLGLS